MAELQAVKTMASPDVAPSELTPELAPLPKLVYVELADYCNLNCMFCGRGAYIAATGDKGGFIEVDTLKKLEQPLRAAQYLGLSGRIGEPLLHPKLEYILQWIYEINPTILLRITTNGTALSGKMAKLLGGHLDFLAISLNASNAEAYFREMRPVGQKSSNQTAWWNNFIRRLTEFITALPVSDRGRVRIIAPVQRDNINDVPDFVRLVANTGCSHAVFTPMQVHDDSKIDLSIYWIKDKYNDVIDEAAALGAGLGIRVEAAYFYTNPKIETVDLDALCREPLEAAYLNMEKLGGAAPCCHWIEELMPADIYSDDKAFERFWNNDIYRRLRAKRDFKSCKACGLARPFDDIGFHFTPLLKKNLVASKRCAEAEIQSSYPESELVRICQSLSLDVRSLRRTIRELRLDTDLLNAITDRGLEALSEIDHACWEAFLAGEQLAAAEIDIILGGCFLGIGWFHPDNDPVTKVSARWMGGARTASVFVRVVPGYPYHVRVTAHHLRSSKMVNGLSLKMCGQPLVVQRSLRENGVAMMTARIPESLSKLHGGCLWLAVGYDDVHGQEGWVSFSRLEAWQEHLDSGIDKSNSAARTMRMVRIVASSVLDAFRHRVGSRTGYNQNPASRRHRQLRPSVPARSGRAPTARLSLLRGPHDFETE